MKKLNLLFVMFAFLFFVSCGSSDTPSEKVEEGVEEVGDEIDDAASLEMENETELMADATLKVKVDGMVCSKGCVKAIQDGLGGKAGVASCVVDYENKIATIKYNSASLTESELVNSLSELHEGQYQGTIIKEEVEEKIAKETEA